MTLKLSRFYNKSNIRLVYILIAILLTVNVYLNYEEIQYSFVLQDRIIEGYNKAEKEMMSTIYNSLHEKAQNKTDRLSQEIKDGLLEEYNGDYDLFIFDYTEPQDNSILVNVIDDVISSPENKYFRNVVSDANDMFVASNIGIVSDRSQDCSVYGITRDFEQEISMHFNKYLATQAIDAMLEGRTAGVFWQFRNFRGLDYPEVKIMNIDTLLQLPLEELKDYEFLVVSYIDDGEDMLGNSYVAANGQQQDNYRLIVVQGFNIYEQITETRYNESFIRLTKEKESQIKLMEEYRRGLLIKIVLSNILLIMTFITIATLLNRSEE